MKDGEEDDFTYQYHKRKDYWEWLRYAVLPNYPVKEVKKLEWNLTEVILKDKEKKYRRERKKLQGKWEKILEAAKTDLDREELKLEQENTSYQEVVANMKRKITITEHSKTVDNLFKNDLFYNNDTGAGDESNIMAKGMRNLRKIEAVNDRLKARKNYLDMKYKKKNSVDSCTKEENLIKPNNLNKKNKKKWVEDKNVKKSIDKKETKKKRKKERKEGYQTTHTIDGLELKNEEYISEEDALNEEMLEEKNKDEEKGQDDNNEDYYHKYFIAEERTGKNGRCDRRENLQRKIPQRKSAIFLFHPSEMRKYEQEYVNNADLQLPKIFQEDTKTVDARIKIFNKEENSAITLPSLREEIEEESCEIHLERQIKIEIRKKADLFYPEVSEDMRASSSCVREVKKTELQQQAKISVTRMDDKNNNISTPVKKLSSQTESPTKSIISPLRKLTSTTSGSMDKSARGVNEIIKTFEDLNFACKADELERKHHEVQEELLKLREALNEDRKKADKMKELLKEREKEYAKIHKLKIAYQKYKHKERERQLRIEMQKKIQIAQEKKMALNRKLHEERCKLKLQNRISRQYNFSYFNFNSTKHGKKMFQWHSSI
eukprot:gene5500-6185_t